MRLKEFKIVENKEGKNLHLEHIEDLIFIKGAAGAKEALQYINSVRAVSYTHLTLPTIGCV